MFPIFAAIGAAIASAIGPIAKAVALAAVGGAAAFGTNKALTAITEKASPKLAKSDTPEDTTEVGGPGARVALGQAQAYLPEPLMTRAPIAPMTPMARL